MYTGIEGRSGVGAIVEGGFGVGGEAGVDGEIGVESCSGAEAGKGCEVSEGRGDLLKMHIAAPALPRAMASIIMKVTNLVTAFLENGKCLTAPHSTTSKH